MAYRARAAVERSCATPEVDARATFARGASADANRQSGPPLARAAPPFDLAGIDDRHAVLLFLGYRATADAIEPDSEGLEESARTHGTYALAVRELHRPLFSPVVRCLDPDQFLAGVKVEN